MKKAHIVGLVMILAFGALGISQVASNITTYKGFTEAKASERPVQVKGAVDKSTVRFENDGRKFYFDIIDEAGERMTVLYQKSVPGNFNQASHVVAKGVYRDGVFEASELLIKCPSKYQGESYESDQPINMPKDASHGSYGGDK